MTHKFLQVLKPTKLAVAVSAALHLPPPKALATVLVRETGKLRRILRVAI